MPAASSAIGTWAARSKPTSPTPRPRPPAVSPTRTGLKVNMARMTCGSPRCAARRVASMTQPPSMTTDHRVT